MSTRYAPLSVKLEVLIDQLGKAAEGTASDKDMSARMPNDQCTKAKDLSSAAATGRRQL